MPIKILDNDTKFSFAYAINYTQNIFTVNQEDGFLKYTGKVVGRIVPNAILAILAGIETVTKAALTVIAAIFSRIQLGPYEYLRDSTSLAARATKEAFQGIFGHSTDDTIEELREDLKVIKSNSSALEKQAVNGLLEIKEKLSALEEHGKELSELTLECSKILECSRTVSRYSLVSGALGGTILGLSIGWFIARAYFKPGLGF